jgi:hypothetical protein
MSIATTPKYKWKLIYGNRDKDHSFWLDEVSGRISIKDESGDLPHNTDDGVLWLETRDPITLEETNKRVWASIPLYSVRNDEPSRTSTCMSRAFRIASKFRMELRFPDAFKGMRDPASIVSGTKIEDDFVVRFY